MRHRGGDGAAVILGLLVIMVAITYKGEEFARNFASQFGAMVTALAPIWVPILVAGLGLLLYRYYWNRW